MSHGKILSKKRIHEFESLRKNALKALHELSKETKSHNSKAIYSRMADNVKQLPFFFYPSPVLRQSAVIKGNKVFYSRVMGENVTSYKIITKGRQQTILKSNYIKIPAEHVFYGDKLTLDGILTICHEYGHFPKRHLHRFASELGITYDSAEELLADTLAAKVAVKMGHNRHAVLSHFHGRGVVYGFFPYKEYLRRAIGGY